MRLCFILLFLAARLLAEEPDYFPAVAKLIEDRCLDCHAADDPEGKFVMETHADILKGGEGGKVLEAGKGTESLMVKYLRGEVVKDGKKKFMPPGKRDKLTAGEIEAFVKWIDAGAKPPQRAMDKKVVEVPKVLPKGAPRVAVTALAFSPQAKLVAVGRYGVVELVDARSQAVVKRLEGHRGNVNAIVWSADGAQLFAASGESAVAGEVKQWSIADAKVLRTFSGHRDMIYALALSPDGKTLATGSYDQKIKLWNVAEGTERRTLSGHNGAVFGLAFRPDGKLLASASADRTVKLWDVTSGERRDTFSQPLKEQFAVAWSADGKRLAAGGADNRIRIWQVSPEARETTNPLLIARFAHDQPILRVLWSADGKSLLSSAQDGIVKVWDAADVQERLALEKQSDWPTALAFAGDALVVGRADGGVAFYEGASGKVIAPQTSMNECGKHRIARRIFCQVPSKEDAKVNMKDEAKPAPKPEVKSASPREVERGKEVAVKLLGSNLPKSLLVKCADERDAIKITSIKPDEILLAVSTPADLPRNGYDIIISTDDGKEFDRVPLRVGDLPVRDFPAKSTHETLAQLPLSVWGVLSQPGESDRYEFDAKAGQTIVFDITASSLNSSADVVLTLADADGRVLATSRKFNRGDAFIAHTFAAGGRYTVTVGAAQAGGSKEHFYNLVIGELPYVTGVFPLSLAPNAETDVELIGYNLPRDASERTLKIKAGADGMVPLAVKNFRSRANAKLPVSELPNFVEDGSNRSLQNTQVISVPACMNGRIPSAGQAGYFKFTARAGVTYTIETDAARRGSPMDTKLAVLWPDGRPVERMLFQAVRDSAQAFKGINSNDDNVRVDNWKEMELNQWLWMQGEVAKLFAMPEGPDSGFGLYSNGDKRIAYFNTTATSHPLDEPCYIVEPHAPGTKLVANGLPIFTLHYENDDDGLRELGTDSRILFTAPKDGEYVVRVQDSRGFGGGQYAYRLLLHEARLDFSVSVTEFEHQVSAGSGKAFTYVAKRIDGFDGEIRCEVSGVPSGWYVNTPLVVQAGQLKASGVISALPGAKQPTEEEWKALRITASADVLGKKVIHEVAAPQMPKLKDAPKLFVSLHPGTPDHKAPPFSVGEPSKPREITIAPGEIIPAWLVARRSGENDVLRFDVENLPHGVIVDSLGLNGITLLEGQESVEIFIKAESWVPEQDRLAYGACREAGKQASLPVLIHVRKKDVKSDIVNVK